MNNTFSFHILTIESLLPQEFYWTNIPYQKVFGIISNGKPALRLNNQLDNLNHHSLFKQTLN